ncbi:MAG: LPS export ABC transporter periplasmic protein LptC [Treponema sp.]|nr:LPS export ABC transporter periplasmic protein LptC [Treponema sp.]
MMKKNIIVMCNIFIILAASCTFDYGESKEEGNEMPDLVMENVEYVRVRSSDPIARFQAERAERYEKQGVMKLMQFSFEQYGEKGEEVNAVGQAGFASVDIQSGDVSMNDAVRLEVESEDIILETELLEWKDEPRTLSSGNKEVTIIQESGTRFTGLALFVEARKRTWEFSGAVSGTYISEDDEEESEETEDKKITASVEDETTVQRPEDRDPETAVRQPTRRPVTQQTEEKKQDEDEEQEKIDEATLK